MNFFKSHFRYTKNQRNGIFLLLFFILIFQVVFFFVDFKTKDDFNIADAELLSFQNTIDSLKSIEIENRRPKLYPFNPNYITDFKGAMLGMSLEEIDRLHKYRNAGRFINSSKEFKQVTKVSDSLLRVISPFFKFPDWIVKKQAALKKKKNPREVSVEEYKSQSTLIIDINKATVRDFLRVNGVTANIAERIVKYRGKLQGYSYIDQLYEVWGLKKEVATNLISSFKVLSKPNIKKINVNTASFKEVLKIPYIDYKLCKQIFEFRDEVAELQDISEIKNIQDFPVDKYDRITLYLTAE